MGCCIPWHVVTYNILEWYYFRQIKKNIDVSVVVSIDRSVDVSVDVSIDILVYLEEFIRPSNAFINF